MNKLIVAALIFVASNVQAAGIADQFSATLLDHVSITGLVQDGHTDVALLDSIIQIGKHNGEHVLGLQAGFAGAGSTTESQEATGAKYLVGATLRLSPFIKSGVNMPAHWEFLKALEFGPAYHYDLREKESKWSIAVGLAFDPAPKQ